MVQGKMNEKYSSYLDRSSSNVAVNGVAWDMSGNAKQREMLSASGRKPIQSISLSTNDLTSLNTDSEFAKILENIRSEFTDVTPPEVEGTPDNTDAKGYLTPRKKCTEVSSPEGESVVYRVVEDFIVHSPSFFANMGYTTDERPLPSRQVSTNNADGESVGSFGSMEVVGMVYDSDSSDDIYPEQNDCDGLEEEEEGKSGGWLGMSGFADGWRTPRSPGGAGAGQQGRDSTSPTSRRIKNTLLGIFELAPTNEEDLPSLFKNDDNDGSSGGRETLPSASSPVCSARKIIDYNNPLQAKGAAPVTTGDEAFPSDVV